MRNYLVSAKWLLCLLTMLLVGLLTTDGFSQDQKTPEEMIREATKMLETAKSMLSEAEGTAAEGTSGDQAAHSEGEASDSTSAVASANAGGFDRFDALMAALSIFVLAVFVGFEVITKVPPTLHTPLMSGSNAISGITLVGALIVAGRNGSLLGVFAVLFAMVNVIGGFWVTHRMLSMFKR